MAAPDTDSDVEIDEDSPIVYVLHNAAESGEVDTLQRILFDEGGAAQLGLPFSPAIIKRLLSLHDVNGCTPLHLAILNGHVQCAELLLKAGSKADLACDGNPPLHLAVNVALLPMQGHVARQLVELLLAHGAQALETDDCGRTAVHWAAATPLWGAARGLVKPLVTAAMQEREEQLRAYQAAAAEAADAGEESGVPTDVPTPLELQDADGNTPLHLAARFFPEDPVQSHESHDIDYGPLFHLLDLSQAQGWDLGKVSRMRNNAGYTPLHLAALHNRPTAANQLTRFAPGCIGAADKRGGRAASELARRRGYTALSAALKAARKDPGSADWDAAYAAATHDAPPEVDVLASVAQRAAGQRAVANDGDEGARVASRCVLLAPEECESHLTAPEPQTRGAVEPPPENLNRLRVLTTPDRGSLRAREFEGLVSWQTRGLPSATMSDVLRVHDWSYVRDLAAACAKLEDSPQAIGRLDADTAVSRHSYLAALKAAGAVCAGVDAVVSRTARTAFCAVRPPGHHAGPIGVVPSENDPHGSHGFCLLSNIAIGAAYALNMYRHQGIKRVAILDFDVHHGNGTQACVANVVPATRKVTFSTPFSEGVQVFPTFKPWLDASDSDNIFFASVQGYGRRLGMAGWFYPGSGATSDNRPPASQASHPAPDQDHDRDAHDHEEDAAPTTAAATADERVPEDPDNEFAATTSDTAAAGTPASAPGPRIINVGIPGPGAKRLMWRRAWRDKILPALINFAPDLIFVSAGFDAHKKDDINMRYVGVTEGDYEWVTDQITQVANKCCGGRVVSVLEGGYNTRGGLASAFARSAAAHVRALAEPHTQAWDAREAEMEREAEAARRAPPRPAPAPAPASTAPAPTPATPAAAGASAGSRSAAGESMEVDAPSPPTLAPIAAPTPAPAPTRLPTDTTTPAPAPAPASAAGGAASAGAAAGETGEEPGGKRRRRGSGHVDYAALNAKLEGDAGRQPGGGAGGGAAPS